MEEQQLHEAVAEYYGQTVKQTKDLKFDACVVTTTKNRHHTELLQKVSPKVLDSFYGCGSPIPDPLEGCTVVDLGSGTGRDCFVLSALAGKTGRVIGVDMTQEQIDIANEAIAFHQTNIPEGSPIEFRKGFIEDLRTAGIEDNSVDLVISNCVVNLSHDKTAVFREIFRVLKDGGEVHISDIFSDQPLPQKAKEDKVLVGECIGNAIDLQTFVDMMKVAGFADLRVVEARRVGIPEQPADVISPGTMFFSVTFSAFKGAGGEDWQTDVATYKGGVLGSESEYVLDFYNKFKAGEPKAVTTDVAFILQNPRFRKYFEVTKDSKATRPLYHPNFIDTVLMTNTQEPSSICCCSGSGCC